MPGIYGHTLIGAITGAHSYQKTTSTKKLGCHTAGIWLLSGSGVTLKDPIVRVGDPIPPGAGTAVVHLNPLLCMNRETRFDQDVYPGEEYAIINYSSFVATSSDGLDIFMSAKADITSVPVGTGLIVTDWRGYTLDALHDNGRSLDVKVTVKAWRGATLIGLTPFNWMCTVEVGRIIPIPG